VQSYKVDRIRYTIFFRNWFTDFVRFRTDLFISPQSYQMKKRNIRIRSDILGQFSFSYKFFDKYNTFYGYIT